MKLNKRRKFSRARGSRTCGWAMKKHKGSGNRGGKGMAGTGKRADQRKSYVIKNLYPYFGQQGYTSRKTERRKNDVINVSDLENMKETEINLKNYKILGEGEIKRKVIVKAKAVSKSAREKIEKAGGKVLLLEKEAKHISKDTKKKQNKSEDKEPKHIEDGKK
jgi:large subunit ribosomal protein L15